MQPWPAGVEPLTLQDMDIYKHPTFGMACEQFDLVTDLLQMPQSDCERVKYPKRSLTVAVPVRMDSAVVQVFSG